MNGNELGLIIALIILLMISFFMLGYMYARIKIARIMSRFRPPRHVEIKKIDIKDNDNFHKMMQSIIDELENDEENENDDANGNDS